MADISFFSKSKSSPGEIAFALLVCVPLSFWLRATVLAYGWNTFIVAATGMQPIGKALAFGLAAVVGFMSKNAYATSTTDNMSALEKRLSDIFVVLLYWGVLAIIWNFFVH